MRWLPLLLAATVAHADDSLTGFTTYGDGPMTGRITVDGKPLAGAHIHVVSRHGDRVVTADDKGVYKVILDGQTLVYIDGVPGAKLGGETAETVRLGKDGEAIAVHANVPPKRLATPKSDPDQLLPYTDALNDADVWLTAWVMLDVDATGAVRHVKFLNRPGYGEDDIALKAARKLRFVPARDVGDQPIASIAIWSFEWPSFSWIHARYGRLRPDEHKPDCRPRDEHGRDCRGPDIAKAFTEAWL